MRTYILCGEIGSFSQSGRTCVAGVCASRLFLKGDAFFGDVFYKIRPYDLFLAGCLQYEKENRFSKKTCFFMRWHCIAGSFAGLPI